MPAGMVSQQPLMPHLKALAHAPSEVIIDAAHQQQQAVLEFLAQLSGSETSPLDAASELQKLRLQHPNSALAHSTALQADRATAGPAAHTDATSAAAVGADAQITSNGEDPSALAEAASAAKAAELQQRWSAACKHLHCLPSHERVVQQLPAARSELQRLDPQQGSAAGTERSIDAVQQAPVLLQVALHAPDLHFTRTQTLLARSEHTLADLADAVECANDRYAAEELGHPLHGGIFYLNETIYEDTRCARQQGYVDYTQNILAFLESSARSIQRNVSTTFMRKGLHGAVPVLPDAQVAVKAMQDVKLRDLTLTVAQAGRCLYLHAGACEHIVVFEDVRLQHADCADTQAGPATLPLRKARLEKCCICSIRPAVRITYDDAFAPESPAFFCARCYDDLHLDAVGAVLPEVRGVDVFDLHD